MAIIWKVMTWGLRIYWLLINFVDFLWPCFSEHNQFLPFLEIAFYSKKLKFIFVKSYIFVKHIDFLTERTLLIFVFTLNRVFVKKNDFWFQFGTKLKVCGSSLELKTRFLVLFLTQNWENTESTKSTESTECTESTVFGSVWNQKHGFWFSLEPKARFLVPVWNQKHGM